MSDSVMPWIGAYWSGYAGVICMISHYVVVSFPFCRCFRHWNEIKGNEASPWSFGWAKHQHVFGFKGS